MAIKFYKTKDPHGYMGNYYRARFFIYGRWWDTCEHAYQAQKCIDQTEYNAIHQAIKPSEARLLGQKVKMREGWDDIHKDRIMEECVRAKFLQHKNLRDQLMATGQEELIEDSVQNSDPAHRDAFWGNGSDGTGKNMLGQILMKVRKQLAGE